MDRYASRLHTHLPAVAGDLEYAIACSIASLTQEPQAGRAVGSGSLAGVEQRTGVSAIGRYVRRYIGYPRRVRRQAPDVVHVLDHSYAHMVRCHPDVPAVVTVHDLLPVLTVRRRALGWRERLRNAMLRRVLVALRDARAWIVGTEWLRGELGEWLGGTDGIHVIPFGVDEAFAQPTETPRDATRRRWEIPDGAFLLLHVGSVGERKNIPTVIAALDGLRDRGVNAWLLQVGGRFDAEQRDELAARKLTAVVRQVPAVDEPELRAAYRASDVLLFPSLYEGFGFPVLEAMASELPVVTSGAAGLMEVAGDAATVVSGRNPDRYVDPLHDLATNPDAVADLRARGRVHAARFSWAETARRTVEVYRTLV